MVKLGTNSFGNIKRPLETLRASIPPMYVSMYNVNTYITDFF